MRLLPTTWVSCGVLAGLTLIFGPAPGRAADKSEEVQFETADFVELRGTFYASQKPKAPCVILLHKFGGKRIDKGWDDLATSLQKDYAVLSFDFRGHGDSTNISNTQKFWRVSANNQLIRGAALTKSKISYKDFFSPYMPMLANDVAAARRYLDRQNEAGACNSSNLILIGAEEGAAIGALWLAAEYQRKPLIEHPLLPRQWIVDRQGKVAGEDIAGAIWLTIPGNLNGINTSFWLCGGNNLIVRDKVPMVFYYGKNDTRGAHAATKIFSDMERASRDKMKYSRLREKNTKLPGNELLGVKALGVEEEIGTYLEKVMQNRGAKAWVRRDPEKGPPLMMVPINQFGFPTLR
jgi:hypothetical protein